MEAAATGAGRPRRFNGVRGWRLAAMMALFVFSALAQADLTFTVTTDNDVTPGTACEAGGPCSVRAAINEANAISESTHAVITIDIPAGTYTLGAPLEVRRAIRLVGSAGDEEGDPALTILEAGDTAFQPGNGQIMVINPDYNNSFDTYLAALTLRHGYNTSSLYGGAIDWDGEDTVGGQNNGTLTIYNSAFIDNAVAMAGGNGGAIAAYFGARVDIARTLFRGNRVTDGTQAAGAAGALLVVETGAVTLTDVEIDGNAAQGYGGALLSGMSGQIAIERTTVVANRAEQAADVGGQVGGLGLSDYTGTVSILNSTFSGNEADGGAGGLRLAPLGGAGAVLTHVTVAANRAGKLYGLPGELGGGLHVVSALAPTTLYNTLVVDNMGGTGDVPDNLRGTVSAASSHNLFGPGGDGGLQDGVNGNLLAVADARLLPLDNYHGLTRTHALDNGSPALDAGQTAGTSPASDQRGWPREFIAAGSAAPAPDIGAYEAHPTMSLIPDQAVLGLLSGAPTVELDVAVADVTQPEGVTVTVTASSNTALVPLANILLSGTGAERHLAITPLPGQWGSTDISVRISGRYNGLQRDRTQTFTFTVIAPPELSVSKSHTGDFHQGQSGADFTIAVQNIGDGATLPAEGVVSVVDTLPAGLAATAIGGTGWQCTLATVSCTRNDVLASGASYPPITLTVDVDDNAATSLTNTVSAQGGGDSDGDSGDDTVKVLYRTATAITPGSSVYGTDFQIAASLSSPGPSPAGNLLLEYNNGAAWVAAGSQALNGGSAVFTLDGNSYDAGLHTFRAVFQGNADYHGSQSAPANHIVNQAPQSLDWTPPASLTFGDPAVTVPASSSAGLPVTLGSSDHSVFTVSGNVLTIVGAGTATLTASQPGNTNYSAAVPLTQAVTVAQRPATVTLGQLAQQYDGSARVASAATTPAGLNVAVTYDGAAVAPVNAGSYAVVVTITEANYTGSASGTLVVSKAGQSITFAPLAASTMGDAPFALTGSASSGLAVSYTSSDVSVATVSGDQITLAGAGTALITAAQPGDGNYNAATPVGQTLTVNQGSQMITFAPLAPMTFGDAPLTLTGSSDAGLPVHYASSDPAVATVSGSTLTVVGAGSASITASQPGNDDYLAAADVSWPLVVNKAAATVTLSDLTPAYTGSAQGATVTTAPAGLAVAVTYDGAATVPVEAGSYAVVATVDDANYQGSASGTLVIGQASQILTFDALPQRLYGDVPVTLGATSSSGLAVSYASDNPSVASVSGNILTLTGVGTANITASQGGDSNYLAATAVTRAQVVAAGPGTVQLSGLTQVYDGTPRAVTVVTEPAGLSVDITYDGVATMPTDAGSYAVVVTITDPLYIGGDTGTLVIEKADQSITFAALANRTVGDAPFGLTGSADSGLAVSYTSSDPSVATVSGDQVTVVGAGTTTLTAEQAGDTNYNAATPVAQTLTVDKRDQQITFTAPGSATFGDAPLTLIASSDAGLPITFESGDTSVVSISGNTAVIEGAGSAVITARQAGNDDYNPASTTQTLVVNPASQTLTFAQPADQDYPGSPVTLVLSATSSATLPVTFTLDSGRATLDGDTLTLTGPGAVTVSASQAGDGNHEPATLTRSFQVVTASDAEWTVTQCGDSGDGALMTVLADTVAGNTVRFAPDLVCRDGTAILPGAALLANGLTLDGEGADIEINGAGSHRLFQVDGDELVLRHLLLKDGFTTGQGGAVLAHNASLMLENVRLRGNVATQQGGAVAVTGPQTGPVVLRNVVATGNRADEGGALWLARPDQAAPVYRALLENVTLAQNTAALRGGAVSFADNGVYDLTGGGSPDGLLSLRQVTLAGNSAPAGAALHMVPAQTRLALINSVVAGASAPGELIAGAPPGTDVTGSLVSFGDLGAGDGDPLLAPVSDPALAYYALLPGSAAIGAGDPGLCLDTDQRGIDRTAHCDAGAIQSQGFTLTLLGGDEQQAFIDAAFATPLVASVGSESGEPVAGGRLHFDAPLTGASLNPATHQVMLDASGQATLPVTANGVAGEYTVNVDTRGLAQQAAFSLENLPLTTSLSLTQSGPVALGDSYTVTAVLTASGALPGGNILFERHDGDAWQPFDSVPLTGDTALLQRLADSVGTLSLRARFPGNATHLASDWEEIAVAVYPPLSVTDPQGGDLVAGGGRTLTIAGGEGGSYAIDVSGPAGFTGAETLACGLASCDYTFTAPSTGAFAGTYAVTVTDQSTGWYETLSLDVPLRITLARPGVLSRDPARNQTGVAVSGAAPGTAITLQPDSADSLDVSQSTVVAGDDDALGNPALFNLRLLDTLAASRDVILTGSASGVPAGEGTLRAERSVLYQGSVSGPLSEVIAGASVTLLRASGGDEALPLEDDQGRFLAMADALGTFALIAPPAVAGADDSLEVSAAGYRTLVAAGDCLTPCALVMEAAVDAETPRFTPPAGTYAGGVQVRLESTTPDALLRYTTDGSTPTLTHGTEVANDTRLLLTEHTTLKVVAYKVGLNVSAVAEAEYRITEASLKVGGGGGVGSLLLVMLSLLGWRRCRV